MQNNWKCLKNILKWIVINKLKKNCAWDRKHIHVTGSANKNTEFLKIPLL